MDILPMHVTQQDIVYTLFHSLAWARHEEIMELVQVMNQPNSQLCIQWLRFDTMVNVCLLLKLVDLSTKSMLIELINLPDNRANVLTDITGHGKGEAITKITSSGQHTKKKDL